MQEKKQTIIFGRHPVVDAIESGQPIDKLLLQQGIRGEFEKTIRMLGRKHSIPVQIVPKERFSRFTSGNHQGILGFISLIRYYDIEDVLPTIYEKGETPLLLLLDGVTDVRNFGAIARSAVCCGVHAIIIPNKGSAQINAEAMKASTGALSSIYVCRTHSLVNTIGQLQNVGIQFVGSDLKATKSLSEIDLTAPVAIVMGSEGEGISKSVTQLVNDRFIIPQRSTTNSFNVSVASGIILYEATRQRLLES